MKDDAEDLDHLFELWGEEEAKRGDPEEHPPIESLTAYQAHELSPEEDEKVQEHLAACQECTTLLLQLPSFLEPPEAPPSGVVDFGGEAGWRRLRTQIEGEGARPGRFVADRRVAGFAAAALLAGVLIGGFGRGLIDRDDLQVVPRLRTLQAIGSVRGTEEAPLLQLPVILALSSPGRKLRSESNVEILDAQGRVLRSVAAPGSEDPQGDVLVVLEEGFLKPGSYTIRLKTRDREAEEVIGIYPFRIVDR